LKKNPCQKRFTKNESSWHGEKNKYRVFGLFLAWGEKQNPKKVIFWGDFLYNRGVRFFAHKRVEVASLGGLYLTGHLRCCAAPCASSGSRAA
jgi:hypothetical protein